MREHDIYRLVQRKGSCTISELARALNVSGETIRRNVKKLSAEGLVIKRHGGITLPIQSQEPPIMNRMQRSVSEKKRIAELVASQIEDGDSVIIDTGSTTAYCAQALQGHSNLTIVTNSSYISNLLASRNGNRVFMAGGELRAHDAAAFGSSVIDFFKSFHADKSIISIGAVDARHGCMNYELCEAEVARVVIQQSELVILATDATKFGQCSVAKVCDLGDIDVMVTDKQPSQALAQEIERSGVTLKLALDKEMAA